jgi:hypothetical protein
MESSVSFERSDKENSLLNADYNYLVDSSNIHQISLTKNDECQIRRAGRSEVMLSIHK